MGERGTKEGKLYTSHSNGEFFFVQTVTFTNDYASTLPESTPTPEEVASGLTRLSEVFGFPATLYRISREMSIDPKEFLKDWTAREFYHLVRFLSWESDSQREYSKIMGSKS